MTKKILPSAPPTDKAREKKNIIESEKTPSILPHPKHPPKHKITNWGPFHVPTPEPEKEEKEETNEVKKHSSQGGMK